MSEDEINKLKQEAENKLDEWSDPDMGCCEGYCYSEVADFMYRFAEQKESRIKELEKDLNELTITSDYQRVISEKNEEISALVIKMNYTNEEHKKKFFGMVEIIEYLVDSLKQEGIDLSEEGSATVGYKVYQKIKSLIAERDDWS